MEIIAHRGASGAHPEHTIGAYEAAVAKGPTASSATSASPPMAT